MEVETTTTSFSDGRPSSSSSGWSRNKKYWVVVMSLNYGLLVIGSVSSSLLSRFYFMHGGSSRWVSTLVQSIGFPILLIPILFYNNNNNSRPFAGFNKLTFILSSAVGLMLGVNNLLFSWGISYLPVSTASLLLSSQLAFNLMLSVILVNQKMRLSNVNCVVLLTLSSLLLAFGSSHDMPTGVSRRQFFFGFFATLGAALLFALYLPLMQILLREVKTYRMVMEMQFVMEAVATIFSLVGMAASHGFSDLKKESLSGFDLGKSVYWATIVATVICWQMCFMATAGSVFLTSSLNSGICMTALLSINVLSGVIVFKDNISGPKAVATVMCIWAFSTYLYGEYEHNKEKKGGGRDGDRVVAAGEKEIVKTNEDVGV